VDEKSVFALLLEELVRVGFLPPHDEMASAAAVANICECADCRTAIVKNEAAGRG
jgi:hypothetical protein